jgi:hypothetical protein
VASPLRFVLPPPLTPAFVAVPAPFTSPPVPAFEAAPPAAEPPASLPEPLLPLGLLFPPSAP